MEKLDYRCRGNRCQQRPQCRRYLTGQAAKDCAAQPAAFDDRRTAEKCDGFLQRAWVGNAGNVQPPPGYEVVADDVEPSSDPGAWTCQWCGFRGFWRGGPHCMPRNEPHNAGNERTPLAGGPLD